MPQSDSPRIVWFRHDLRLADNPALAAAARDGRPVIPLFILDDGGEGGWAAGGASRWWLHHSLAALDKDLQGLGARLVLRRGPAEAVLLQVAAESGADAVFWNRRYEPAITARDSDIKQALRSEGLVAESFNAGLLFEPWTIRTGSGGPFKVFTPFWRACLSAPPPPPPEPAPSRLIAPPRPVDGEALGDWRLTPSRPNWASGFSDHWRPGEAGARERLEAFLKAALRRYRDQRDVPARPGTSRLSPHLHFGEIGPRQVWAAVQALGPDIPGADAYLRELGWREFSHHLLFHFPTLPEANFKPDFNPFPWRDDPEALTAWRRGLTGYPIVDAGMRELWATGWMHNRVRMITASFLVKHLLIPWRLGEDWFWDTLVDADLAQNAASWQWVAGSGADAAPYFRIFNPVLQGEKFDPDGAYVRRWAPELARLPDAYVHKPWACPPHVLRACGVSLGTTYPRPIVDHAAARERALAAYAALKGGPAEP